MKKLTALCAALLAAALSPLAHAGQADGRLDIYILDAEGGASTLIVTPAGESLLVDTGSPGRGGTDRIVAAAKTAGITKIDFLVSTHYHGDHIGGAPTLAAQIPIGTLYDNGDRNESIENQQRSKGYIDMKVDKRVLINRGDTIPLKQGPGAKITMLCLGARRQFIHPPAGAKSNTFAHLAFTKPTDETDNANSVVQLLSFGDFRFYDGGDITWNMENELVNPINRVGTVDLYQVTHHGLALSNNPVLVKALEPTVAVMNNGTTKGCEPEVFATLKSTESIKDIWQLHKNLRPDGAVNNTTPDLIANLTADCKGDFVKTSVAPDGSSYTVSIPATGVSKTYETKKH